MQDIYPSIETFWHRGLETNSENVAVSNKMSNKINSVSYAERLSWPQVTRGNNIRREK